MECLKWGLEGYLSRNTKDLLPESDLNQAEVSKEFQWGRTSVCGIETAFWTILVNNMASFCQSQESEDEGNI